MSTITIWTDGSSRGNPGPGGWGTIVVDHDRVEELGGREDKTTNNRMELMAVIRGVQYVAKLSTQNSKIIIRTDSSYVVGGMTKWVAGWQANRWITKAKSPVLNMDLWQELVEACRDKHIVWDLIPGHSGIPGNDRCDEIATAFADKAEIDLYKGPLASYGIDPHSTEAQFEKKKKASSSRGKAFSYVSLVDGEVVVHNDWASCERRVKGKKASFKKVFSEEEQRELIAKWQKGA
jgi:ribonuclease HI